MCEWVLLFTILFLFLTNEEFVYIIYFLSRTETVRKSFNLSRPSQHTNLRQICDSLFELFYLLPYVHFMLFYVNLFLYIQFKFSQLVPKTPFLIEDFLYLFIWTLWVWGFARFHIIYYRLFVSLNFKFYLTKREYI